MALTLKHLVWGDLRHFSLSCQVIIKLQSGQRSADVKCCLAHSQHSANVHAPPVSQLNLELPPDHSLCQMQLQSLLYYNWAGMESEEARSLGESDTRWTLAAWGLFPRNIGWLRLYNPLAPSAPGDFSLNNTPLPSSLCQSTGSECPLISQTGRLNSTFPRPPKQPGVCFIYFFLCENTYVRWWYKTFLCLPFKSPWIGKIW